MFGVMTGLAPERHEVDTEHVESSYSGNKQADCENPGVATLKCSHENFILGEKSSQRINTSDCQSCDQNSRVSHRHFFRKSAHVPDAVAVNRMDQRAGPQKEQRLEEGMREKMEHRSRVTQRMIHRGHTQCEHHITKLTEC